MPTQSSSSIVARLAVAASIAALSLSAAVAAQASNWTGSGNDANWSTAENWDVAVDESSGVAAFPYGTSGDSVVDKDYTLSSLSFLNGADAIRLSVAEGKTLSAGDRVRIASEDCSTGVVEVVSGKINMTGDGLYIARLAGIWYYTDAKGSRGVRLTLRSVLTQSAMRTIQNMRVPTKWPNSSRGWGSPFPTPSRS